MPVLTSSTLPAGASVVKGASCDIVIDSSGNIIGWLPVAFQNIAGGTEYQPIPCIATDPLTGGISLSAGGVQVGGTASPYAFTSRALTDSDNGQTRVCASAQVATVNTGLPNGFGCAFKGAISFDGTATVTDVRTTGATNPWCGLVNTGTNNYDVVGTKA